MLLNPSINFKVKTLHYFLPFNNNTFIILDFYKTLVRKVKVESFGTFEKKHLSCLGVNKTRFFLKEILVKTHVNLFVRVIVRNIYPVIGLSDRFLYHICGSFFESSTTEQSSGKIFLIYYFFKNRQLIYWKLIFLVT